jgi:hypothetical protein
MKLNNHASVAVALFVLLAATQTQANSISLSDQGKVNKRVVFVNRGELYVCNQAGVMIRTIKISKRDLAKLASSGRKGACLPCLKEWTTGFGGCFSDCTSNTSNTMLIQWYAGIAAGTAILSRLVCAPPALA